MDSNLSGVNYSHTSSAVLGDDFLAGSGTVHYCHWLAVIMFVTLANDDG